MKHLFITLLMFGMLGFSACKKDLVDTSANDVEDVNSEQTFDEIIAEGVTVAFFHASWCSNCEEQRPAFEGASEREDLKFATFIEIEYEDNEDITGKYSVPGFPTMVFFKDNEEASRLVGKGHTEQEIADVVLALE